MNKEKTLQLISELIDKGANIRVHMTQYDESGETWRKFTKEEAEEMAVSFQKALGAESIEHVEGELTNNFTVAVNDITAAFSYYPYMIDDLTYEGAGESA